MAREMTEVNLNAIAGKHLLFLKQVNSYPQLYEGPCVYRAIRRYWEQWMPLKAKYNLHDISPFIDVLWVWKVHMQNPQTYRKACIRAFGSVIDYTGEDTEDDISQHIKLGRELWQNEYPHVPFEVNLEQGPDECNKPNDKELRTMYDFLEDLIEQQRSFYYQISHFSISHVEKAVNRYHQYLQFIRSNKSTQIFPPNDIDLMWRAHMTYPEAYARDIQNIISRFLDHPGVQYHPVASQSYKQTMTDPNISLEWCKLFGEGFLNNFKYRGTPPRSIHPIDTKSLDMMMGPLVLETGKFNRCFMDSTHDHYEGGMVYEFSRAPLSCVAATHKLLDGRGFCWFKVRICHTVFPIHGALPSIFVTDSAGNQVSQACLAYNSSPLVEMASGNILTPEILIRDIYGDWAKVKVQPCSMQPVTGGVFLWFDVDNCRNSAFNATVNALVDDSIQTGLQNSGLLLDLNNLSFTLSPDLYDIAGNAIALAFAQILLRSVHSARKSRWSSGGSENGFNGGRFSSRSHSKRLRPFWGNTIGLTARRDVMSYALPLLDLTPSPLLDPEDPDEECCYECRNWWNFCHKSCCLKRCLFWKSSETDDWSINQA